MTGPLTTEQLLLLGALIAIVLWVISLADDSADAEHIGAELDRLPVLTRRDVKRVLSGHRWR